MDPRHNPFGVARVMAEKDVATYAHSMSGDEPYILGPDSLRQDDVPQGRLIEGSYRSSRIYPGTTRDWAVYIPAQYSPDSPADLIVFQDGRQYLDDAFGATHVLDNLIARGELRPTIGVFVEPGAPGPGHMWGGNSNRQIEYDAVDDDYARFLVEEVFPVALDGLNVTEDPERRAICGMSSGGICAFTAAWHRPDYFRRVISHCGSYINILGGHLYPRQASSPGLPADRRQGPRHRVRQHPARQSADARRTRIPRLRRAVRVRRGRPHSAPRRCGLPRHAAMDLPRLTPWSPLMPPRRATPRGGARHEGTCAPSRRRGRP
jgi:hypothetical protein